MFPKVFSFCSRRIFLPAGFFRLPDRCFMYTVGAQTPALVFKGQRKHKGTFNEMISLKCL